MARILVVDDNAELRQFIGIALRAAGHEVVDATHGVEGVQRFREEPFDLVLCDILMPEKEGFETIRELRALRADVRIIAMSGGLPNAGFDPLPIATMLGAYHTLAKPFDLYSLQRTVAAALPTTPHPSRN